MKKLLLSLLIFFSACSNSFSDYPSFGTATHVGDNQDPSSGSYSFAHNNNREDIVCGFANRGLPSPAFTSATYNGVAMTEIIDADDDGGSPGTGDLDVAIYFLQGATTGSNTVAITLGDITGDNIWAYCQSVSGLVLTGADATASSLVISPATGTDITTVASYTVIFDVFWGFDSTDLTVGANQTQIAQSGVRANSDQAGGSYEIPTSAGVKSMTWTTSLDDFMQAVASFAVKRPRVFVGE